MNVNRFFLVILLSFALLFPVKPLRATALSLGTAVVPADGGWIAETLTGDPVSFNISSSGTQWDTFVISTTYDTGLCQADITYTIPGPGSIVNSQFSYTNGSGTFLFTGQFASSTEASGTFSFSNFSTGCGSFTRSGTWISPVGNLWSGTTNLGKSMSFKVMRNGSQWYKFILSTSATVGSCSITTTRYVYGPGSISGHQFSYTGSTYSFTGKFNSPTNVTGTYAYVNEYFYGCGYLTQSGTWTASIASSPLTAKFYSVGQQDGWILESAEASNAGGSMNSAATSFNVGDDAQNCQYRAILHFNTTNLPDKASITAATLKIKKQALVGTNPFPDHQNILVDIKKVGFSDNAALQLGDFLVAPNVPSVGVFKNTPLAGNWYSTNLANTSFPYINLAGATQFRLRFKLDDDNDNTADYLRFFSGNFLTNPTFRPVLIVSYYIFP